MDQTEIGPGFRERMAEEEPIWNAYIDKIVAEKREEDKKIK